jgi:bacillithiol synthase
MRVHARIPAATLTETSALYRDFIGAQVGPIHRWLPPFGEDAASWKHAFSSRSRVDAALVTAVRSYNENLSVCSALLARLDGLRDGSVRAVVTGQQPGVMGGPLMSLYKAATAIALARRIEEKSGRPCVPLFWLGSDDDDFAEVRELSVLDSEYSRLDVALDASAYRPGLRIGDMEAAPVRAVWNAVAPVVPRGRAHDHLSASVNAAGDFADAAARVLVSATGGHIAIIDARTPELRIAARELLLNFYDREPALRQAVDTGGRELEAQGYHAQVQWGADSNLFVVEQGVRRRVPPERRADVRRQIERDISVVSPGVIARSVLQDSVLSPLAVVLGPAEIAYRAQMAGVYRELRVEMPVVVPRLSATYLPPAVSDMIGALGLDGAGMVSDPGAILSQVNARGADDGLKAAAAALETLFAGETRGFLAKASARLDEKARQKLQKRIDEIAARLAQTLATAIEHDASGARARWPFLPRLVDMFRKDTVPQERFLSMVVPMLYHNDDAWKAVDGLATEWTRDALDGRVWHGVYSV